MDILSEEKQIIKTNLDEEISYFHILPGKYKNSMYKNYTYLINKPNKTIINDVWCLNDKSFLALISYWNYLANLTHNNYSYRGIIK